MSIGGDTVQLILRTAVVDADGSLHRSYRGRHSFSEERIVKPGCSFEIRRTTEKIENTDISSAHVSVWLPWDDDTDRLDETSAIEHRDRIYELTGPPHTWTNLQGLRDHIQCICLWQGG